MNEQKLDEIFFRFHKSADAAWKLKNYKVGLKAAQEEAKAEIQLLYKDSLWKAEIGWEIQLPDLPYFQIICTDDRDSFWRSPICDTKNLPVQLNREKP
jgi:hypothetical protein